MLPEPAPVPTAIFDATRAQVAGACRPSTPAAWTASCNVVTAAAFVYASSFTFSLYSSGPVIPSRWYRPSAPSVTRDAQNCRGAGDHRPALCAEPLLVAGREVVLPLRDRDVGSDVLLVEALAEHRRRRRDLLGAVERALPREARALCAGRGGVRGGRREPVGAVGVHRRGQVGMLREQRRVHPRVGVPEDVAVVPVRGETGGRDAPVGSVTHARPEIELARVHRGGERRVPEHVDPARPHRGPRRVVFLLQRVVGVTRGRARVLPALGASASPLACEASTPTYFVNV